MWQVGCLHRRHLANTIDRFLSRRLCGLRSNYFDHLLHFRPHRTHEEQIRGKCVIDVTRSVCVCLLIIIMSCAKTAEPIEMRSGVWTPVDQRNHALAGGPGTLGTGAILAYSSPLWSRENILSEPKLCGRCQRQCDRSPASAVRLLPSAVRTATPALHVRSSGLFCGRPGTRYQTTCEIRHAFLCGSFRRDLKTVVFSFY